MALKNFILMILNFQLIVGNFFISSNVYAAPAVTPLQYEETTQLINSVRSRFQNLGEFVKFIFPSLTAKDQASFRPYLNDKTSFPSLRANKSSFQIFDQDSSKVIADIEILKDTIKINGLEWRFKSNLSVFENLMDIAKLLKQTSSKYSLYHVLIPEAQAMLPVLIGTAAFVMQVLLVAHATGALIGFFGCQFAYVTSIIDNNNKEAVNKCAEASLFWSVLLLAEIMKLGKKGYEGVAGLFGTREAPLLPSKVVCGPGTEININLTKTNEKKPSSTLRISKDKAGKIVSANLTELKSGTTSNVLVKGSDPAIDKGIEQVINTYASACDNPELEKQLLNMGKDYDPKAIDKVLSETKKITDKQSQTK